MTYPLIIFSNFILGALGAWTVSKFAAKVGLLDHPNERSSHSAPTPKGGGIGILMAFILGSALISLPVIFWGPVVLIAGLGFLNDFFDFSPKLRLLFQVVAGGFFALGAFNYQGPHWDVVLMAGWMALATIYIIGTANFYNFMDGINGIAGISGIVGFGLLALFLDLTAADPSLKILAINLAIACAGFLTFNLPQAKVFMGDVGSLLLGFVFGGMVIRLSTSLLDFICLTSFLFPFYADELTTMAIRLKDRDNLLQPHRRHLYQLLANEKKIPHWRVSTLYGLMQLSIGLSVLFFRNKGWPLVLLCLGFYLIAFTAGGYFLRMSLSSRSVS